MKQTLFVITLLLIIPSIVAAQTPTRERRSSDLNQSATTESSAVRNRVVGSRAANHADGQRPRPDSKTRSDATPQEQTQKSSESTWGNTAVIIRPTDNTKIASAQTQTSPVNRSVSGGAELKAPRRLVQPTSLVTETPVRTVSYTRPLTSARAVAPTAIYNVGVGDVLDIRLSNLPTRESTLFTVMKNGTLEYPLLSSPVTVTGLTTDEVANLLSSEIKVIESARVSVSVRDYASHAVMVTGFVESPGRKILRREAMPLYTVLAGALVRPEATVATITRNGRIGDALPLNNEQAMATLVQPGDLIKISGADAPARQFLYVGGEVASPGEKSFREGMTLTQAILSAGGASRTGKNIVRVARRNANGFLNTSEYSLRAIEEGKSPDPLIQAGDRIEVTRTM